VQWPQWARRSAPPSGNSAIAKKALVTQHMGDQLWVDSASARVYKRRPHTITAEFDGKTEDGRVVLTHDVPAGVEYMFEPKHEVDVTAKAEVYYDGGRSVVGGAVGTINVDVWDLFEREYRGKLASGYVNYGTKARVRASLRAVTGDKVRFTVLCPDFAQQELSVRIGLTCDALIRMA